MDCHSCNNCEKLLRHKWRVNCGNCGCNYYNHQIYLDMRIFDSQILEVSLDDKEFWIAPEFHKNTSSLSQLKDYRSAISLAREHRLIWLPIGLQPEEIETFQEIWSSTQPDFELSGNDNQINAYKRAMLFCRQIPLNEWLDAFEDQQLSEVLINKDLNIKQNNLDGNNSSFDTANIMDELEAGKLTKSNFKKDRDTLYFGFGELEKIDYSNETDDECLIMNCEKCKEPITAVHKFAVNIKHCATASWHIGCFSCSMCNQDNDGAQLQYQTLFDFHYCWDEENHRIVCVRHFGQLKYNRCGGCDNLIFDKDFTKAMSNEFHVEHFACENCDVSLTGDRYILREDKPYCLKCFNDKFTNICDRCQDKISCDSKDLSFNNKHWHDNCFYCDSCSNSLVDKTFGFKDNEIFCPNCFELKFAPKCSLCNLPFKSGSKKFEYNKKQWHEDCFLCVECKTPIGSKSFVPRADFDLICLTCYENKYAQKCSKCQQAIKTNGVTYREEPWHKECFVCNNCNIELANIKFTSRDNKPFCPDCFTKLYSRRCKSCQEPISGIGGCKYISLDNDNWHTDCFKCSKCMASLVGKGFLTHESNILCPECFQIVNINSTTN